MIGLIVARSKNNVIGKNGQIPWRIKGEQKQFKELTTGNTVIMGRKSYEEIGHPLPNRMNIVVSNTANYSGENLLTVHSLQEALDAVKEGNVYISGGYGLFKEALPLVDTMYIKLILSLKTEMSSSQNSMQMNSILQLANPVVTTLYLPARPTPARNCKQGQLT